MEERASITEDNILNQKRSSIKDNILDLKKPSSFGSSGGLNINSSNISHS